MHKKQKKKHEDRQEQMNKEIAKNIKDILYCNLVWTGFISKIIQEEEDKTKIADAAIQEQIVAIQNNLTTLTGGMLSIQGRQFKEECRVLLQEDHNITLAEFEHITNEHRIYNELHGNHEGDNLYNLVEIKYEANLHH